MIPTWYYERWEPMATKAKVARTTEHFAEVYAECEAAIKAGERFRVTMPHGGEEQMQQLGRLGVIERL